ncbi:MAG: hypothetical protein RL557_552 [archaeon]
MNKKIEEKNHQKGNDSSSENGETHRVELIKKQNSQLKWALFIMVSFLIIIVAVPYVHMNFINTFHSHGLTFQKTKMGELVFYSTKFPVISLTGKAIGNYAVNLRNDPRELRTVSTNVTNNTVRFTLEGEKFAPVYITLNPNMKICEDTVISMAGLSSFLINSGLNVSAAYADKEYAKQQNATYRWCDTSQFDTVIYVTDGKETVIKEIYPHCYQIEFTDCEILRASERFQLIILEEYMKRVRNTTSFSQ